MSPVNAEIQAMKKYLEHGEMKEQAERFNIAIHRAKDLLSGRTKPKERDMDFITALYDLALPRKQRLDKLKVFIQ